MIFNCRAAKRFGTCTVYAGAKNIFSYIQDEKHTDDAAFMYAPVYGRNMVCRSQRQTIRYSLNYFIET